jgi:hypothetical protein
MPYSIDDAFQALKHFAVPEAKDTIAMLANHFGALGIVVRCITVLAAVEFNGQLWMVAGEICNVPANLHLPPEMASFGFQQSQVLPQYPFSWCCVVSQ